MAKAGGIRAGRAYVEVGAEDAELRRALRESEARLRDFAKKLNAAGKGDTSDQLKRIADRLLPRLSREALGAAARAASQLSEATAQFVMHLRSGQATWEDLPVRLAEAAPIVRDIFDTMKNIAQAIDPVRESNEKWATASAQITDGLKGQLAVLGAANDLERAKVAAAKEYSDTIAKIDAAQRAADPADAATAAAAADQQRKYAAEIRRRKVSQAESNTEVLKSIRLLEQEARMVGQAASFVELDKILTQGATIEQLAYAEALIKTRDANREAVETAKRQQEAVNRTMASLREQRDLIGLSVADTLAYKLANDGATESQVKQAQAIQQQIDAMEEFEKAQERAKQIIEEFKSPLQAQRDQLIEIRDLHRQGLLDDRTLSRAFNQIRGAGSNLAGGGGTFSAFGLSGISGRQANLERNTRDTVSAVQDVEKAIDELGDKLTLTA